MNSRFPLTLAAGWALAAATPLHAVVFTQWNFNSNPADANAGTGTLTPVIGAGTATLIGETTSSFNSGDASGGSSDPATGDDSGWSVTTWAPQGEADKTRGVQFSVSTVDQQNITITWDQRHSNTAAKHVQFQYSTDGTTFTDLGDLYTATAGDTWFTNRLANLSSITGVNNNANFAFRIVQSFAPSTSAYQNSGTSSSYNITGTWRFDMVTINATPVPEPEEYAAMAAGGLAAFALWRRRHSR
jgi:MYXO-CTERM domain-containing protein